MRPAIEVATQICGCADARQRKSDIALIEADRAELVAEVAAWLPHQPPHLSLQEYAQAIETKFGGRDGK